MPLVGIEALKREVAVLRTIWETRPRSIPRTTRNRDLRDAKESTSAHEWESALGALVIGREPTEGLGTELQTDAGVNILRKLAWQARAGVIVENFRLTARLVMLISGEEAFSSLLTEFFAQAPPSLFSGDEAIAFATFVAQRLHDQYIVDVVTMERAGVQALIEGRPQIVRLHYDPTRLIGALEERRIPALEPGAYEVTVTPDDFSRTQMAGVAPA